MASDISSIITSLTGISSDVENIEADVLDPDHGHAAIKDAIDSIVLLTCGAGTIQVGNECLPGTSAAPDAVTDLSLLVISGTQVDLSWSIPNDNGSPITGYHIVSKVNGVVSTIETSFGDASTTSYSDTLLSAGDVVTYRIAAINAGGTAPFSNVPPNVITPP